MSEFEVWAYRTVISLCVLAVWYFIRKWMNRIVDELKQINSNLVHVSETVIKHGERLGALHKQTRDQDKKITDLSLRTKTLEHRQDTCINCNKP